MSDIPPQQGQGPYTDVQGRQTGAQPVIVRVAGDQSAGAGGLDVVAGLRGTINDMAAANQEMTSTVKDLAVLMQRNASMGGTSSQAATAASINPQDLASAVAAGMYQFQAQMGYYGQPGAVQGVPGLAGGPVGPIPEARRSGASYGPPGPPTGAGRPARGGRRHGGYGEEGPGMPPGVEEGETYQERQRRQPEGRTPGENIRRGLHYDIGGLKEDVGRFFGRHLSEAQWGTQYQKTMTGPEGKEQWRRVFQTGESVTGPGGIQIPVRSPGIGIHPETDEGAITAFKHRDAIMRILKGGLQGIGTEGGGIGGALGGMAETEGLAGIAGTAGMVLGGVGGAALLAQQGLSRTAQQRAINAQFQSVSGGTNMGGMGARLRSKMFGLSEMGMMGSAQAEQLYYGTLQAGMQAGSHEQTRALNFGISNYKSMGMGVQDTMELVSTAIQHGVQSFDELHTALVNVTKAAKEAGVNAESARKQFTSYYQAALGQGEQQGGAVMAQAQTLQQTMLGRSFQGMDLFSNLTTAQSEQQQATLMHMPYKTYRSGILGGDTGLQARGQQAQLAFNVRTSLQGNQQALGVIDQARNMLRAGGGRAPGQTGALSQIQNTDITRQLLEAGLDDRVVQQIMSSTTGQQLDRGHAMDLFIGVATGEVNLEAEQKKVQAQFREQAVSKGDISGAKGSTNSNMEGYKGTFHVGDREYKVGGKYLQKVLKTGNIDPLLAGLSKDQKFKVTTPSGDRIVGLEDLQMKFKDQVDAGMVDIVEGPGAGGTVQDFLKAPVTNQDRAGVEAAATHGDKALGKVGKDYSKWQSDQNKKGAAIGKITIEAGPALANLLRITGYGAVVNPTDQYNGRAPVGQVAPPFRPGNHL